MRAPIAINYRGTTGAGKTTLVREVMNFYPSVSVEVMREGRLRPILTRHEHPVGGRTLAVLGHYQAACGGCDTIKELDDVFALVRQEMDLGHDVLFEGLILSGEIIRSRTLLLERPTKVWGLKTPIKDCIANVYKRRLARGVDKPFKEKNSTDKARCVELTMQKLEPIYHEAQDKGIDSEVAWGTYDCVLDWTKEMLDVV